MENYSHHADLKLIGDMNFAALHAICIGFFVRGFFGE